jgi:hypothetical protein
MGLSLAQRLYIAFRSSLPSCLRCVTRVRGWAGGEDAGDWRAEGEGLGAQVREAGVAQQVLDFAGSAAGRVRRGAGAAGLGRDGNAPGRREPSAQLGEQIARAQAARDAIRHGLRCPHEDITQCPNFNAGVTARLAGQPLSRSHQQLHGQRFHEVTDSF